MSPESHRHMGTATLRLSYKLGNKELVGADKPDTWGITLQNYHLEIKKKCLRLSVGSGVEYLPRIYEVLDSTPSTSSSPQGSLSGHLTSYFSSCSFSFI